GGAVVGVGPQGARELLLGRRRIACRQIDAAFDLRPDGDAIFRIDGTRGGRRRRGAGRVAQTSQPLDRLARRRRARILVGAVGGVDGRQPAPQRGGERRLLVHATLLLALIPLAGL